MASTATDPAWGGPGDVFARLAGGWTIERCISNGAALDGIAHFTPDAGGVLCYLEQGVLRLADGQSFKASRAYVFHRRPDGFAVHFAEEPAKLFHAIALRAEVNGLAGEGEHPCRDDLYRSNYAFRPDGSFVLTHVVKGPRHDYTMTTQYRRAASAP
jgi:hypothetical protein